MKDFISRGKIKGKNILFKIHNHSLQIIVSNLRQICVKQLC